MELCERTYIVNVICNIEVIVNSTLTFIIYAYNWDHPRLHFILNYIGFRF